jgi:hypothetical protein
VPEPKGIVRAEGQTATWGTCFFPGIISVLVRANAPRVCPVRNNQNEFRATRMHTSMTEHALV